MVRHSLDGSDDVPLVPEDDASWIPEIVQEEEVRVGDGEAGEGDTEAAEGDIEVAEGLTKAGVCTTETGGCHRGGGGYCRADNECSYWCPRGIYRWGFLLGQVLQGYYRGGGYYREGYFWGGEGCYQSQPIDFPSYSNMDEMSVLFLPCTPWHFRIVS
jgi:hypothetical protein